MIGSSEGEQYASQFDALIENPVIEDKGSSSTSSTSKRTTELPKGSVGPSTGDLGMSDLVAAHADWDKFLSEARPSTNIEDVRNAYGPVRSALNAWSQFSGNLANKVGETLGSQPQYMDDMEHLHGIKSLNPDVLGEQLSSIGLHGVGAYRGSNFRRPANDNVEDFTVRPKNSTWFDAAGIKVKKVLSEDKIAARREKMNDDATFNALEMHKGLEGKEIGSHEPAFSTGPFEHRGVDTNVDISDSPTKGLTRITPRTSEDYLNATDPENRLK